MNQDPRQFFRSVHCGLNPLPALLICILFLAAAAGQQPSPGPQQLLTKFGFSRDQILQVERGAVVAKVLKSEENEVAAVAAVRMHVPRDFFVARVRDIERHKKSEAVLQSKKISDPAQEADFADLVLLPQEWQKLKECRPGDCGFKLSAQQMDFVREHVDFSGPNIEDQANAAMRALLLDYAHDYQANGNKAAIVYADKSKAVSAAAQFSQLVNRSSDVFAYAPEFRDYLLRFPDAALEGVERFLYWSRDSYGHDLQPIITITDLNIYQRPGRNPPVLLASKQIYASHYLEASLALTLLFESRETDPSPSFYLIYVNRSRVDLLRKWYSFFARGSISDKAKGSLRTTVADLRTKVETEYKASEQQARQR